LKIQARKRETSQTVEKSCVLLSAPTNFNCVKSCAAIKLFRNSDLTSCFKALLSGGSVKSVLGFKLFFAPDDLHKLPDFVVIVRKWSSWLRNVS
jgi:hypothetical protein